MDIVNYLISRAMGVGGEHNNSEQRKYFSFRLTSLKGVFKQKKAMGHWNERKEKIRDNR